MASSRPYDSTSRRVATTLQEVFASLWPWFDEPTGVRQYRPTSGGWTIDQVLEHISLTNHFLMLTLTKYVEIAERRSKRTEVAPGESDLDRLNVIGERGSFGWPRPEHMEPKGLPTPEIRETLEIQLRECLALLHRLDSGLGSLCRITMTVNALGKIDLYQWLYFIAQHARRHVQQMEAIKAELQRVGTGTK